MRSHIIGDIDNGGLVNFRVITKTVETKYSYTYVCQTKHWPHAWVLLSCRTWDIYWNTEKVRSRIEVGGTIRAVGMDVTKQSPRPSTKQYIVCVTIANTLLSTLVY